VICLVIESSIINSKSKTGYKSDQENTIYKEDMCEDDSLEIFNLETALKYFKTAREYKFIYLVYSVSKESKYFSPYSFKTVNFKNIDKNCFFTLSNKGMMSNIQNEVTFTPLEKFEEDYSNYQKLVKVSQYEHKIIIFFSCFMVFRTTHSNLTVSTNYDFSLTYANHHTGRILLYPS
jgi:hypothetical protein